MAVGNTGNSVAPGAKLGTMEKKKREAYEMRQNKRARWGLLLALCMALLLVTPASAGVTDVTGGGGIQVNTTVLNHYTDTYDKRTFDLKKGDNTFTDAARFFGSEQGALTVTFPDLKTPVALTYRVTEDTVVMTITNYDDLPAGRYTCSQQEDKTMMKTTYDGSRLEYNSTTYEGGILVGDPDALFNAYTGTGKVIINETRHDYYTRHHILRGYTLYVAGDDSGWNADGWSSGTGVLDAGTDGRRSPKTFDPGMTLYAVSAMLSGAGLAVLRRRKR